MFFCLFVFCFFGGTDGTRKSGCHLNEKYMKISLRTNHNRLFAASHSRGTKPPCWRAKVALGQDKQRKLPFQIMYVFCLSCPSASKLPSHWDPQIIASYGGSIWFFRVNTSQVWAYINYVAIGNDLEKLPPQLLVLDKDENLLRSEFIYINRWFTLSLLQKVQLVNFCTLHKLSFKVFL